MRNWTEPTKTSSSLNHTMPPQSEADSLLFSSSATMNGNFEKLPLLVVYCRHYTYYWYIIINLVGRTPIHLTWAELGGEEIFRDTKDRDLNANVGFQSRFKLPERIYLEKSKSLFSSEVSTDTSVLVA